MVNNALKHGQTMYVLGLTYAIGIIKIYGDKSLQELEQKLKQEQEVLDGYGKEKQHIAGNALGGKKAAKTNKERYGEDFYKIAGRKGGKVSGVAKGFAGMSPEKQVVKADFVAGVVRQRKMIMFDNLTNYGMIDMMEHQFNRYNKLNFGSYKYIWQKWIRK